MRAGPREGSVGATSTSFARAAVRVTHAGNNPRHGGWREQTLAPAPAEEERTQSLCVINDYVECLQGHPRGCQGLSIARFPVSVTGFAYYPYHGHSGTHLMRHRVTIGPAERRHDPCSCGGLCREPGALGELRTPPDHFPARYVGLCPCGKCAKSDQALKLVATVTSMTGVVSATPEVSSMTPASN
jgi:hypothetical protein